MRDYKELPDPTLEPAQFNMYLVENNVLLRMTIDWILIENSYIDNQLVCFFTSPLKYFHELSWNNIEGFYEIVRGFPIERFYINPIVDRSVKNRLHIHVVKSM